MIDIIKKQLFEITSDCDDEIANLSNISAILSDNISDINWVGFYIVKNNNLILGPFQGKKAKTKIEYGNGVCGKCWEMNQTIVVDNVHEFENHIACDIRSNSEIVIPLHKKGIFFGVLDIDSISYSRFSNNDKENLENIAKYIEEIISK